MLESLRTGHVFSIMYDRCTAEHVPDLVQAEVEYVRSRTLYAGSQRQILSQLSELRDWTRDLLAASGIRHTEDQMSKLTLAAPPAPPAMPPRDLAETKAPVWRGQDHSLGCQHWPPASTPRHLHSSHAGLAARRRRRGGAERYLAWIGDLAEREVSLELECLAVCRGAGVPPGRYPSDAEWVTVIGHGDLMNRAVLSADDVVDLQAERRVKACGLQSDIDHLLFVIGKVDRLGVKEGVARLDPDDKPGKLLPGIVGGRVG
jgi:hypothetical protein